MTAVVVVGLGLGLTGLPKKLLKACMKGEVGAGGGDRLDSLGCVCPGERLAFGKGDTGLDRASEKLDFV